METYCFGGGSLVVAHWWWLVGGGSLAVAHYCQKKFKNFNKNFAENPKQIFSSFKKFGKHTDFEQI